jgi:hypothetical protein
MAMKETSRQVYRTARGKEVDMGRLIQQNELTIAVGNAGTNARGDKLGPGGQIIKRREELQTPNSIPEQISVRQQPEPTPAPAPKVPVMSGPVTLPTKKDISDQDPEGNE